MNRIVFTLAVICISWSSARGDSTPLQQEDLSTARNRELERLQKEEKCVEAATTWQELQNCRPRPPGNPPGPPPGGH